MAAGIVAFLYCRQTLWSNPQSVFFNSDRAHEFRYSAERLQDGRAYINATDSHNQTSASHTQNQPVMCVGMVTAKRRKEQYLDDTIGTMLVGLTPEERSAINVRLLFADFVPDRHPDWDKDWLNLVDW
jgi:hypothetical protein